MPNRISLLNLLQLFFFFALSGAAVNSRSAPPAVVVVPSDALALISFKSKADVHRNLLPFTGNTTSRFCRWVGVQCYPNTTTVVRLVLRGMDLGGVFAPDTLSRLDQLRVLTLQSTSLHGTIPDLSNLKNLKTLFLDHNSFAGAFPPSIISLHRVRTIDLSSNNLSGPLPPSLTALDRLNYLRLEHNRLNGTIPPLNQSSLVSFNVSGNLFSGAVPVTPTLLRLNPSSFSSNPSLCGEIVHKECRPGAPFFAEAGSPLAVPTATEVNGVDLAGSRVKKAGGNRVRTAMIVVFSCVGAVLLSSVLCYAFAASRRRRRGGYGGGGEKTARGAAAAMEAAEAVRREQERELEEKVKRAQMAKSGSLAFCAGEAQLYSLDQLMRASAEMLGRGAVGTTYKAVLDNRLIVCVKRLDASRLAGTSREAFESHMESVGGLRHPNLVPLRAYFQAKDERLLVYDYQPNGSLFSLIHGSKSSRARPLHWTSCLKIAEDVAQGLSYIHQAWRLVHGNLTSHNVLLGPDFEACVADYCLSVLLTSPPQPDDNDSNNIDHSGAYRAPEIRNSTWYAQATAKSDVYAFGILLLELVTGRVASEVPAVGPEEMAEWVKTTREGSGENNKMEMMVEVAIACSLGSAEQRPTMWQVMKMLQEIKDTVLMEETSPDQPPALPIQP